MTLGDFEEKRPRRENRLCPLGLEFYLRGALQSKRYRKLH